MKKTLSINLGGQVFQIDEDAYEALEQYLEALKMKYASAEGGAEIIEDIEARLAEMFLDRMENNAVVTIANVEHVIQVMGRPEDFETDEETEGELFENTKQSSKERKQRRRLFRNPDDKVVEGVLSGLSAYLGLEDPIWLRLAFVIFLFTSFGTAAVVYIILILVIPEAKTASEKLQMRGEPITVDNIERTIRRGMDDLKGNLHGSPKSKVRQGQNAFRRLAQGFIELVVFLIKIVGKLIGLSLILVMLSLLTALVLSLVLPGYLTNVGNFEFFHLFFYNQVDHVIAIAAIILVVGIPILSLLMFGFHLLLGRNPANRTYKIVSTSLWILGFVLGFYTLTKYSSLKSNTGKIVESKVIDSQSSDVLYLQSVDGAIAEEDFVKIWSYGKLYTTDDSVYIQDEIKLDVAASNSRSASLEVTYLSKGKTRDEAFSNAECISYEIQQDSNRLSFPTYFRVPLDRGYPFHSIRMTLKIPNGTSIYLDPSIRPIIYDIKNVTNTYDGKMIGHTWMMLPAGLTCMDCDDQVAGNINAWESNGKMVSKELNPFDQVVLKGFVKYEIINDDTYRTEIDEKQLADYEDIVSQYSSKLIVDASTDDDPLIGQKYNTSIKIFTPDLNYLQVSGATNGHIRGLVADELEIELAGFHKGEFDITANLLKIEAEAATSIELSGQADKFVLTMDGAAEVNAFELQTKEAKVNMDGACKAEISVSDKLDADLDGVCKLAYKGLPKILSDVSGFSSIKPAE